MHVILPLAMAIDTQRDQRVLLWRCRRLTNGCPFRWCRLESRKCQWALCVKAAYAQQQANGGVVDWEKCGPGSKVFTRAATAE